jgi:hypothetical protein
MVPIMMQVSSPSIAVVIASAFAAASLLPTACSDGASADRHIGTGGMVGGSGGTGGMAGSAGTSGTVPSAGATYPCSAEDTSPSDGGLASVDAATDPPALCTVGQTYCYVLNVRPSQPQFPTTYSCLAFGGDQPDTSACVSSPTCDCLCSHGYICRTTCRCSEANGFATMSCDRI